MSDQFDAETKKSIERFDQAVEHAEAKLDQASNDLFKRFDKSLRNQINDDIANIQELLDWRYGRRR